MDCDCWRIAYEAWLLFVCFGFAASLYFMWSFAASWRASTEENERLTAELRRAKRALRIAKGIRQGWAK